MQQKYLTHNGGRIYFYTFGEGEPILFIHGFTLDHRMWQPQIDFFKRTHQVIAYDARGFGKSSVPIKSYKHTDDLKALLNHLNIPSAHIVGLSMGGRIGASFAVEHPNMVRSLTLLDSALDGFASTVNWEVHAKEAGLVTAKQNWFNHEIFEATRKRPEAMSAIRPIINDYTGWHWLHDDVIKPAKIPARARLYKIKAPTIIAVGENDLSYFQAIADVLAAGIPGSKKVIVPKAGHMTNLEAPEFCNKLILEHITL